MFYLKQVNDVEDFHNLAQFYSSNTPSTFRDACYASIFQGAAPSASDSSESLLHIPIRQAICIPVSAEELLETLHAPDNSTLRFFVIDCRPANDYNECHLSVAYHLEASLICNDPAHFESALQVLLDHQEEAKQHANSMVGDHLCFLGTGGGGSAAAERDQYLYMVIARLLSHNHKLVSQVNGGFAHLLHYCDELELPRERLYRGSNVNIALRRRRESDDLERVARSERRLSANSDEGSGGWRKWMSGFRSKADQVKDRLEKYMDPFVETFRDPNLTDTNGTPTASSKPLPALTGAYPGAGSGAGGAFFAGESGRLVAQTSNLSVGDDDEDDFFSGDADRSPGADSDGSDLDIIDAMQFVRDPSVIAHWSASEIVRLSAGAHKGDAAAGDRYVRMPCRLVLTPDFLFNLRIYRGERGADLVRRGADADEDSVSCSSGPLAAPERLPAVIVAKRPLTVVVKITAKKHFPDVITFKYGVAEADGRIFVTDVDRFHIPHIAKSAVMAIKDQIIRACNVLEQQQQHKAEQDQQEMARIVRAQEEAYDRSAHVGASSQQPSTELAAANEASGGGSGDAPSPHKSAAERLLGSGVTSTTSADDGDSSEPFL